MNCLPIYYCHCVSSPLRYTALCHFTTWCYRLTDDNISSDDWSLPYDTIDNGVEIVLFFWKIKKRLNNAWALKTEKNHIVSYKTILSACIQAYFLSLQIYFEEWDLCLNLVFHGLKNVNSYEIVVNFFHISHNLTW